MTIRSQDPGTQGHGWGTSVGQAPQALGPGEEFLQMCAHAPNAGDPCCISDSAPQPVLGFHSVPGAAKHWEILHGHPMLGGQHPTNSREVLQKFLPYLFIYLFRSSFVCTCFLNGKLISYLKEVCPKSSSPSYSSVLQPHPSDTTCCTSLCSL